jgi:hypothetical protein
MAKPELSTWTTLSEEKEKWDNNGALVKLSIKSRKALRGPGRVILEGLKEESLVHSGRLKVILEK